MSEQQQEQPQEVTPFVKLMPHGGQIRLEVVGMDQGAVVKLLLRSLDLILFTKPKEHEQRPALIVPSGQPLPNFRLDPRHDR